MKQNLKPLQDLRGIAILLVVLYHAEQPFSLSYFKHGGIGVSLFFMISGFIISYTHSNDKGGIAALNFTAKRITRIYIPYIPIFTVIAAIFLVTNFGSEYHKNSYNIIKNLLLVQTPSQSIHPYAWSLVYEIFYYSSFCIIVILLRVNVIIYAIIIAAPAFIYINAETNGDQILISFQNFYFACGVLLGRYHHKIIREPRKFSSGISLIIFAILLNITSDDKYALFPLLLFFITYLYLNSSALILNKIGTASYSIYLTHALIVPAVKYLPHQTSPHLFFIVTVLSSIFFGILYSNYFELPITRIAQNKINKIINF